jgi:hypothetical protein
LGFQCFGSGPDDGDFFTHYSDCFWEESLGGIRAFGFNVDYIMFKLAQITLGCQESRRTQDEIANTTKLDGIGKLWVTENLTTDRVLAHVLLVDRYCFCNAINVNHAWREACLEFYSKMKRDWFCYLDMREKAIRCRR